MCQHSISKVMLKLVNRIDVCNVLYYKQVVVLDSNTVKVFVVIVPLQTYHIVSGKAYRIHSCLSRWRNWRIFRPPRWHGKLFHNPLVTSFHILLPKVDPYHTLFGLAGLSLLGDDRIKPINPVYCLPQYLIEKLKCIPKLIKWVVTNEIINCSKV